MGSGMVSTWHAWLSRGGDFGEQLEENAEQIWARVLHWRDEKVVDWKSWAKDTILNCCIHWNSPNQTFANDLAIWALNTAFSSLSSILV